MHFIILSKRHCVGFGYKRYNHKCGSDNPNMDRNLVTSMEMKGLNSSILLTRRMECICTPTYMSTVKPPSRNVQNISKLTLWNMVHKKVQKSAGLVSGSIFRLGNKNHICTEMGPGTTTWPEKLVPVNPTA